MKKNKNLEKLEKRELLHSLLKFQHDLFFLFISNSILLEGAKWHNPSTHEEEKQKSRKIREMRTDESTNPQI
jgi:hypothetical protein